jgi:RNA polymerase primary sigma factor
MGRKVESSDIPIEIYFREISKYPLLTPEEEKEYIKKAKEGDKTAIEKIILSNLRFVVEIASKYRGMGVPIEDLINEGNIGLIKAIKYFDPKKGVKFLSYAIWWIRQSIMKALDERSQLIRIPSDQKTKIRKIKKAEMEYFQKYGELPTIEELSKITGLPKKEIEASYEIFHKELSLDRPFTESEKRTWEEMLEQKALPSPEEFYKKEYIKEKIKKSLEELDKKERDIISLYFGIEDDIPRSLEEIGKIMNLSKERVRQLKERALLKLKEKLSKYKGVDLE